MVESLLAKEVVTYPNGGKSYFYVMDRTVLIVDEGICKCDSKDEVFPYTLITDKQNDYMHRYEKVYRFLVEDRDTIEDVVQNTRAQADMDFTIRVANREENADASPLELLFEKNFTNVYGMNALKYLWKEYGVVDHDGHNYFLDYYVGTQEGGIAVEENGVSYHHPQIIGVERYRKQLQKQNTCTQWGIKLYRFSTEDCQFESRIEDDIRVFFGEDMSRFEENGLLIDRRVELYEHQAATLQDMEQKRAQGVKTFLIVFPTASGKSRIARGLPVDRPSCPYNTETLKDRKLIKSNMLTNPLEKFERKRFLYQSKDLGVISMNHALLSRMDEGDFRRVKEQMVEDVKEYFREMGV